MNDARILRPLAFRFAAQVTVAGLLGFAPAAGARGDEPHSPAAIEALVAQLSSGDYAVRAAAAKRLLDLGDAATDAVNAAARSPDPETRFRATRLAIQLREAGFDERLEAFVSDVTGRSGLVLPGWREYCRLVGSAGASRRVFAQLYRSNPELFAMAFGAQPPRDLGHAIEQRAIGLQGRSNDHTPAGDDAEEDASAVLAVLAVAALQPGALSDRGEQLITQLARSDAAPLVRGAGAQAFAARRLLTGWVLACRTEDLYVLSQLLQLADGAGLRDATPLAIAIATGERSVRPSHAQFRAGALLVAGRLGSAADVPSLEPLLADRAVCASQSGRGAKQEALEDVEVRDVALAVILHLQGARPQDCGFEDAVGHPDKLFLMHSLAFRSPDHRDRAQRSWRLGGERLAGAAAPALRR